MDLETRINLLLLAPEIAKEAHPLFVKNHWIYAPSGGLVPSEYELEDMISYLISDLYNTFQSEYIAGEPLETYFTECGRWHVNALGKIYLEKDEPHEICWPKEKKKSFPSKGPWKEWLL